MNRSGWAFSLDLAVVHGTAAVVWLGMVTWGLFGDCRPHDVDGQCGMSTTFAGLIGLVGAFVVIVGGGVLIGLMDRDEQLLSRGQRRFWMAWATAVLAGIAALEVVVIVGLVLNSQPLGRAVVNGLGVWPVTAFLGAPGAYTTVVAVAAASEQRVQRSGRANVAWTCGVGAVAGMLLGFMLSLHWAYSLLGHAWIVLSGAWAGGVVGWVFWRVGLRGQVHCADYPAERLDARDAI